ncbi:hypothetical protein BASA83_010521 [Batrachochytrium salamandrivorans]|nr:hypothetical protein BASA83_010521 [Batrachochytrium salamandrivorans]
MSSSRPRQQSGRRAMAVDSEDLDRLKSAQIPSLQVHSWLDVVERDGEREGSPDHKHPARTPSSTDTSRITRKSSRTVIGKMPAAGVSSLHQVGSQEKKHPSPDPLIAGTKRISKSKGSTTYDQRASTRSNLPLDTSHNNTRSRKPTLVSPPNFRVKGRAQQKPTCTGDRKVKSSGITAKAQSYENITYTSSGRPQMLSPNYKESSGSEEEIEDSNDSEGDYTGVTPSRRPKSLASKKAPNGRSLTIRVLGCPLAATSNADVSSHSDKSKDITDSHKSSLAVISKQPYTPTKPKRRKLEVTNCFTDSDDADDFESSNPLYVKQPRRSVRSTPRKPIPSSSQPTIRDPSHSPIAPVTLRLKVPYTPKVGTANCKSRQPHDIKKDALKLDNFKSSSSRSKAQNVDLYRSPGPPESPPNSSHKTNTAEIFELTGTLKKIVFAHSGKSLPFSSQESTGSAMSRDDDGSSTYGIDDELQAMLMRDLDEPLFLSGEANLHLSPSTPRGQQRGLELSRKSPKMACLSGATDADNESSLPRFVACPANPNCAGKVQIPYSAAMTKALDLYETCRRGYTLNNGDRERLMNARQMFCRLHTAEETVIPQGLVKGYPMEIDFKGVRRRVEKMRCMFKDILLGRVHSVFLDLALVSFRELGKWKAQANDTKFLRLSKLQCGYYGWRGGNAIFKVIQSIFRGPNSDLNPTATAPQSVLDYIQNVLVPEAALHLIAQDQKLDMTDANDLEKVREIMRESAEFGRCVHGDLIDSDSDLSEDN